jgi:hypothetical protein
LQSTSRSGCPLTLGLRVAAPNTSSGRYSGHANRRYFRCRHAPRSTRRISALPARPLSRQVLQYHHLGLSVVLSPSSLRRLFCLSKLRKEGVPLLGGRADYGKCRPCILCQNCARRTSATPRGSRMMDDVAAHARRFTDDGNDAHRHPGTSGWQGGRLDGARDRRAIPPLRSAPRRNGSGRGRKH